MYVCMYGMEEINGVYWWVDVEMLEVERCEVINKANNV